MENNITRYLRERYTQTAFAHDYIIGVNYKGVIYATFHGESVIEWGFDGAKVESGEYAIRYRPNNKQRTRLLETSRLTFPVCTTEELESMKHIGFNRGEVFEMLILKHYGKKWVKRECNDSHKDGADITIDGIPYEIKYEQGTLCKECDF